MNSKDNSSVAAGQRSTRLDLNRKKCIISDLDGTVFLGEKPIGGTVEFIKRFEKNKEFFFLTNNTSMIPEDYINRLASFGIVTDQHHIVAPHIPLIKYLREEEVENIFIIANSRYTRFVQSKLPELKINEDIDKCQAVIVAYDTELTYEKLKNASLILHKSNVKFLATHCDMVCPTELGPIPDAGSILALLETSTGRKPDYIFGKPNRDLLTLVLKKYKNEEIVIVGDRMYTDKILADKTGIDFILVLSGESTRDDAENSEFGRGLIVNDLGDLLDK